MKPTFSIRVDSRHRILVYVWPTLDGLRKSYHGAGDDGYNTDRLLAYWRSKRLRITARGRIVNKVVGAIHLPLGKFGAGIFAHELQHFVDFWGSCKVGKTDNEYLPTIAGDMRSEFWAKYYALWPRMDK